MFTWKKYEYNINLYFVWVQGTLYIIYHEGAIGVAGGAIAPPDFHLVGQAIHYAPPDF